MLQGNAARRSREEAEGEILEAAAALLRERPLHEVTVSAIMERTTLSRKSFYVYFRDRYELLTRLFRPLRRRLDEANAPFLAAPAEDLVTEVPAVEVVARFFAGPEGALVRALHEAIAYDGEAARVWREFNEPVIAAFTDLVDREIRAGRVPEGLAVEPTVRALVGMNLYCFFDQVVGNPEADLEAIAATLQGIWTRTFLLTDPPTAERAGIPLRLRGQASAGAGRFVRHSRILRRPGRGDDAARWRSAPAQVTALPATKVIMNDSTRPIGGFRPSAPEGGASAILTHLAIVSTGDYARAHALRAPRCGRPR